MSFLHFSRGPSLKTEAFLEEKLRVFLRKILDAKNG